MHREPKFQQLILQHLQTYPQMQIQDVYKLCYQAAMGNAHHAVDASSVRNYLHTEFGQIEPDPDQPLFEKISPPNDVVRLNLRSFKAGEGDLDHLYQVMIQSSAMFEPSLVQLMVYWQWFEKMTMENSIPFSPTAIKEFTAEIQSRQFPAVHHSAVYRESYRPAYRVILKDLIDVK